MEINKNSWIAVWLLIFLGWFAYLNNLTNLFVYDDYLLIIDNPRIKTFSNFFDIFKHDIYYYVSASNFYRPLVTLSLMVDFSIWGFNTVGYHVTNNLIHIANAVILFFLVRRIFKNEVLSLLVGSMFVMHPVHTQAVTYVSGRADPMYTCFLLSSMLLFLKSEGENIWQIIFSYFLFILALLSKEVALILPALICVVMAIFVKNAKLKKYFLGFLLICLFYVILRIVFLRSILDNPGPMPIGLSIRLLNLPKQIVEYISLLILPINLHIERNLPVSVGFFKELVIVIVPPTFKIVGVDYSLIFSWLLFILIIVFLCRIYKKHKGLFFSGMWFFVGIIPVSNLFPINALVAEHWLYLPSIGFFVFLGICLIRFSQKNNLLKYSCLLGTVLLLASYFYLTFMRNRDWRNEIVLYRNILKYLPANQGMRVHYNLGCAYFDAGLVDLSIKEYEKALALKPKDNLLAYFNLSRAYLAKKNYAKANFLLQKAIETKPKNINDEKIIKEAKRILESLKKKK